MGQEYETVEEYISLFPKEVQEKLRQMRKTILDSATNVVEGLSYGMPAYKTSAKPLVYFAAFKNHIGLYATPSGHEQFKNELSAYKQGKGSVQFPINEPLPLGLIAEIVKFKALENKQRPVKKKEEQLSNSGFN